MEENTYIKQRIPILYLINKLITRGTVSMKKARDNEINKILEAEEKLIMDLDNLIRQKTLDTNLKLTGRIL